MKKLISLLLVIIFICSALAGCDRNSIFKKKETTTTQPQWEAPEGVVETVTIDKDGNSITIAHSDNFTQDDIDFVIMQHKVQIGQQVTSMEYYTLARIIRSAQNGSPLFLMHFENPYVICSYLKPDQQENSVNNQGYDVLDVAKYVWYKFYDVQSVPKTIDGMELCEHSYLLYDCTVVCDISNGVEYNRQCKYYLKYNDESSVERTATDMIIYFPNYNVGISNSKFIKEPDEQETRYQVYTDEAGGQYLVMLDEEYFSNEDRAYPLAQIYLEDYYDILYPHFTRNEALDVKYMHYNGVDYTVYRMKQIELDLLVNLMFIEMDN